MYEQWGTSTAAVIPDPDRDVPLPISGVTAVPYVTAGQAFQPAWDENMQDKDYVICVHGWRKGGPTYPKTDLRFYKGRSDEITMFKRLWHRGFKGRYIGFIWPTYDVEVGAQSSLNERLQSALQSKFAWSEYRAWKCGEAFKTMVNGLPAEYKKKVMAHSLGNVVVGSALEQGAAIDHYALLNAAIPAYCYDAAAALPLGPAAIALGHLDFSSDPDAGIKTLSYRGNTAALGKARLEGVAGVLTNFYLPNDEALLGWQVNQFGGLGGKPIGSYEYDFTGREIQWDPASPLVNRKVTDPHEAMSMVNNSWSNALGREASTGGKIDPSQNFDMGPISGGMGFGQEHEAVFKWQCAKTWKFYELLWNALDLPKTIAP